MEIVKKNLREIAEQLQKKEIKVQEVVQACFEQIERTEPKLNAFITLQDQEELLTQAKALDTTGPDSNQPLWGVPLGIKDVLTTQGIKTTCASKILSNFIPPYDAEVVSRLKRAGAIILGKQNMDEFAMGSSTENSAFGPTKNPWDLRRVPGGSSGGSAASVASCQCFAAIGTDTGGSIRQPACFCGLIGVKPSYGLVSRYGLIAYGSSFDQAGPLTRSVEDSALLMEIIAGFDPKDSTSLEVKDLNFTQNLKTLELSQITFGLPKEYFGEGLDPEVQAKIDQLIQKIESQNGKVVEVSLPHTEYAIAAYYILVMAEASSNLARFDGVRYGFRAKCKDLTEMYEQTRTQGFGQEVQRRIMLGTYVLSAGYYDAYYKKAAQVRRLLRNDFEKAFQECDCILAPVSPTPAFPLGQHTSDPLQMYLMDVYTISLNLAGLPGIALPCGLGEQTNLPIGLQIIAPYLEDQKLLQIAYQLEQLTPRLNYPPL